MDSPQVQPVQSEADRRNETVLMELLKQKQTEASGFVTHYIRALTLSVLVTGSLLKFALDQNSTPSLRIALSCMGNAISVLALVPCWMGERVRKSRRADLGRLL